MNKTKNTSQINVQKMKQLLKDISTKNEELLQENADINTKLTSLVILLKHKDDIINKIRFSISHLKNYLFVFCKSQCV